MNIFAVRRDALSTSVSAKVVGQDSDLLYRAMDIRIGSQRHILTPARAVDARLAFDYRDSTPAKGDLFEYFRAPKASTIAGLMTIKEREQKFSSEVNSIKARAGDKPFVFFMDYNEDKYPNSKELEFIVRCVHSNSDLTTMPLVSRVTDKLDAGSGFDRYVSFLREAVDVMNTYNRKPMMGVIPLKTPFIRIQDLVDFYLGEGIEAFCLDFATSKPHTVSPSIEQVLYSLAKSGKLDTAYIHAINVSPGDPGRTLRSHRAEASCPTDLGSIAMVICTGQR